MTTILIIIGVVLMLLLLWVLNRYLERCFEDRRRKTLEATRDMGEFLSRPSERRDRPCGRTPNPP